MGERVVFLRAGLKADILAYQLSQSKFNVNFKNFYNKIKFIVHRFAIKKGQSGTKKPAIPVIHGMIFEKQH